MPIDIDNRDLTEVNKYLEARIEALQKKIKQLEYENEYLTTRLLVLQHWSTNPLLQSLITKD